MTAYDIVIEKMKKEIEKSLDKEVADILFRKLFKDRCQKLDIIFNPFFMGQQNNFAIKANANGVIEDIDLDKLRQFRESINKSINYDDNYVYAIITKTPKQYITKGDVLAYVNSEDDTTNLELKLNEVFVINTEKQIIRNDLKNFKKIVISSIDNNEENEFERALNVYEIGLDHYIDYTKKFNLQFNFEQPKSPFFNWSFLNLINNDFEEIGKKASEKHNTKFIQILSLKLFNIFKNSILYTINYNENSIFKITTSNFSSIYIWSFKYENDIGIHRSFHYPHKMILELITILENEQLTSKDIENLVNLLYQLIDVLFTIFKYSITNNDFDTFKEIYEFTSSIPELTSRIVMDDEVKNELLVQYFEACSYIVKKIDLGEFEREKYHRFLNLLLEIFSDYEILVTIIEMIEEVEYGQLEIHLMDLDILWEEYPLYSAEIIDSMGRILLLFCLRGIQLIEISSSYTPLNSSNTIKGNIDRIIHICETIKNEKSKWFWLLGSDIDQRIDIFLEECKKSVKNNQ